MQKGILKYPYPYKAWVAIANDPDNTIISDWNELHGFIWEELKLPFGDSLFVRSFNENLPEQVSLEKFPEIAQKHHHDIIHTWGDYMHARRRGFDREDAVEAVAVLKGAGITPRVWIDHASFVGNMIHGTTKGAQADLVDSSGHVYSNFVYSLDLAIQAGVRYIWNGEVTPIIGQDRAPDTSDVELHSGNRLRAWGKVALNRLPDNRQYYPFQFSDGSKLYCFRRHGTWQEADIDGLGNLISQERIDQLIAKTGSMVVYTHLGKRHPRGINRSQHIPEQTRAGLKAIKDRFVSKQLMVSSVSEMLDYQVIRDHIQLNGNGNIEFRSDGIRFQTMTSMDLADKCFSFQSKALGSASPKVLIDGVEVNCQLIQNSDSILTVKF
ncbi:MAG: hypothetical protein RL266_2610 [Bacteroidota bacterium]|jgi:hypothetical protein